MASAPWQRFGRCPFSAARGRLGNLQGLRCDLFLQSLGELAQTLGIQPPSGSAELRIRHIQTDTRLPFPEASLFVALQGPHYDAHRYLHQALAAGATAALIRDQDDLVVPAGLPVLRVPQTLAALQRIAAAHHQRSGLITLAVTGSNGKTIFKDLLVAMLSHDRRVTASPGSFNSQVGVALALLQLQQEAELAIVEAGISEPGEMTHLQAMIRPTFGVFTNVGYAHLQGLGTRERIAAEKCQLFKDLPADGWLLSSGDPLIELALGSDLAYPHFAYSAGLEQRLPQLQASKRMATNQTHTAWQFPDGSTLEAVVPVDAAWSELFQTLRAAVCAAHLLGASRAGIQEALCYFEPPQNCLELWQSQQGFTLINDSYSSDPVSVRAGLQTLAHFNTKRRIFLFGGMAGLGDASPYQHARIGEEAARLEVDWLIGVGNEPARSLEAFRQLRPQARVDHYADLDQTLVQVQDELGADDCLLIKGPRQQNFAKAAQSLKGSLSPTAFRINLSKIGHNLAVFQAMLATKSKIMVMVKAFAYGMDAVVVARYLQTRGISHFGVAYVREAQELRRSGIHLPIAVQLVMPEEADTVVRLGLQPVVFHLPLAQALAQAARRAGKRVHLHLKIDTGMGRFGLFPDDLLDFLEQLKAFPELVLEGVMTHLSAAEDPAADDFTQQQLNRFQTCLEQIRGAGYDPPLIHAAATSTAIRFPQARHSMVRLGLGLYGVSPSPAVAQALPAPLACPFALTSRLGFIKTYPEGYPISYNRRYRTKRPSRIAFIPMGYHDGLDLRLSNQGHVRIGAHEAPIIGSICMDFTAVDVTDIAEAVPGSPVLILGQDQGRKVAVETMAEQIGTIPYEILSRLSRRIQRIYTIEEQ